MTRRHTYCGVSFLPISAACLAFEYSVGTRNYWETLRGLLAPCDLLLTCMSRAVSVLCWRKRSLTLHHRSSCPSLFLVYAATSLRAPPAILLLLVLEPLLHSAKMRLEGTIECWDWGERFRTKQKQEHRQTSAVALMCTNMPLWLSTPANLPRPSSSHWGCVKAQRHPSLPARDWALITYSFQGQIELISISSHRMFEKRDQGASVLEGLS